MDFLLFWFICAVLTGFVAAAKGRSGFGWFIIGLFFGFISLLAVGLAPGPKKADPNAPHPDTHVRCPECREFVYKDASKCKHCGTKLVPQ